jgi:hypothetical protein
VRSVKNHHRQSSIDAPYELISDHWSTQHWRIGLVFEFDLPSLLELRHSFPPS